MIVSVEAEKSFNKTQHPLMIKPLRKLEIKDNFLNLINTSTEKPMANITLNGGKTKFFSLKIKNKSRIFALTIAVQHSTGNSSWCNKAGKGNKRSNR